MLRLFALLAAACGACSGPVPRILSVTLPADTRDHVGPYTVSMVVRDVTDEDEVRVLYRAVDTAAFVPISATRRSVRGDLYFGDIPGQPPGSRVSYWVEILRDGSAVATDPAGLAADYSFRVLPSSVACRVDSDCLAGQEICDDGTCRAFTGTCLPACPNGYVCDDDKNLCVIAPIPCAADLDCPAAQVCDRVHALCIARGG